FYPAANLTGTKPGEIKVVITPLVRLDKHLWESYECGAADLGLLLHLKEEENKYLKFGSQPQELSRLLSGNKDVSEECREECIRFLMEYYYENYESDLFEHYLKRVQLEKFSKKERARIIHFFIQRGFDGRAAQALMQFGVDEIEVKRLDKLALRYLEAMDKPAADSFLLYLAHYIFECGRCDKELLSYLCGFYHGATEAMYAIWKSARAEELDTESLEESLLGQMLFSQGSVGNAQAVFLSYYRYGTNRKLIRAFLNYYAYRFLLNDRMISAELFELMEREVLSGDNEICTLALLKHYAQEEGFTQRQRDFLEHKLSGILKKGIILPFFKRFEEFIQYQDDLYDKTFVEYHTDPSHHVVLHYRIGDAGQFSECTMKNICHGIFVASFVLFGEESMQYYITEEYDGRTVITESTAVVKADGTARDGKNHYDLLNLILTAHEMKDDLTVMKLLENYIRTEYEAGHLFHIRV
ncbi:MAG: RecX family transcriptional regulator, partial [Lachnospiraceae bacterium]|nr:RecX family transcriptional regulator [Lachnospiraceae bacterium]